MAKKVAYITRHTVSNYGSLLQTYATQKAIEKLGYEAVCINYWREDELLPNLSKTLLQTSRWNKNLLTRLLYMVTQRPVFTAALKKFENFRKPMLKLTEREYHTVDQLQDNLPLADVYMTGSDQTWNTITKNEVDPAYFLSFVPDDKKKIAYAASFGTGSVKQEDRLKIKSWLKRYDSISIREDSGVKIAESMGVKAQQVLDPTFLLEPEEWIQLLPERVPDEKYVLVYQLHPSKAFDEYAKEFSKRKKLKLLRIHPYFHHIAKNGKFIYCPSPEEFLWYIHNAEYFITDSFHGTAFAIGLNTQFINILPKMTSERIESILNVVGLQNRVLKCFDDFGIADIQIDFSEVNRKIRQERMRSLEVLKQMIEE